MAEYCIIRLDIINKTNNNINSINLEINSELILDNIKKLKPNQSKCITLSSTFALFKKINFKNIFLIFNDENNQTRKLLLYDKWKNNTPIFKKIYIIQNTLGDFYLETKDFFDENFI